MACHFARWVMTDNEPNTHRLPADVLDFANTLSPKLRVRFIHGRALLAEMMFYLYGSTQLPQVVTLPSGRPSFASSGLPDFSLAYAGNTIGVMLSSEGKVGLDLEILHARSPIHQSRQSALAAVEKTWIAMQTDPDESASQLECIRQSVHKLSGQSDITSDTLSLHPSSGRLRSSITPNVQVMSDIEGAEIWSCAHTPAIQRLICWRYTPTEGFTRLQTFAAQQQVDSLHFMKLTSLPPAK
ncbi:4'-phosphopantetheinyl transferase superfamily protein [Rouxiella sp. WC2420]